jgi:hypothetical protein
MKTALHIVVACTDRKRATAGLPVRLRDVPEKSVDKRFAMWWSNLSAAPATSSASELYVGDHWSVALTLCDTARRVGFEPTLWVASAGYGLIPGDARLAPYSATFAVDSPDSVTAGASDPRRTSEEWWSALGGEALPSSTSPRQVSELVSREPAAMVLLVASPAYVTAMRADLSAAVDATAGRGRLLIVTSNPGPADERLRECWVPSEAPLRIALGGALTSLHVRAARHLLERASPSTLDAASARKTLEDVVARSGPMPRHERERGTDSQVRAFIRGRLASGAKLFQTGLLREFRAAGNACEQSRFRELFREETGKQ